MPDAPDAKPDEAKPDAPKPDAETSTPPWGDDFDAARAWATITSQREAEQALKAEIATLKTAAENLVPKADLDAALQRAETAEASVKTTKREAALAKAELPEELHAFVTADDEDGIADQIAKLTAALKPSGKTDDEASKPADDKGTPPAKRPEAGLVAGHGGEEPPVFDPDAIVAAIRG